MDKKVDVHKIFGDFFDEKIIQSLAYHCSKKLELGSICLSIDEFNQEIKNTISQEDLLKSKWVGIKSDKNIAFIIHERNIYLQRYFSYETTILNTIRQLISSEDTKQRQNKLIQHRTEIIELLKPNNTETDWQFIASLNAFTNRFSLITGGPGTGKTTSIAKLLSIIYQLEPESQVTLVAPTGKAAMRMKESLLKSKEALRLPKNIKDHFDNIQGSTIHRLLGFQRGTHYFKHNQSNPISYDWLIVDEASMIGISLFYKLLNSIPKHGRIIVLGDKNQLSSVDAGSVFGDICNSLSDNINHFSKTNLNFFKSFNQYLFSKENDTNPLQNKIVELKKNYRFKTDSSIGKLSQSFLSGTLNTDTLNQLQTKEFKLIQRFTSKDIKPYFENFKSYTKASNPKDALIDFKKFRILCPSHIGKMGVKDINNMVQSYLDSQQLINNSYNATFYEHQPIMISSNDYYLQLFNGDIGIIRKNKEGELKAYFESENGTLKAVNPQLLRKYETVFAMSIHKSQGSEFENVVMIIPDYTNVNLLNRELIYTGITRAKKKLTIFASANTLIQASHKQINNATGLAKRLSSL